VERLVAEWRIPLVLDADALNALSASAWTARASVILTPHPGEMARFLGVSRAHVLQDPAALAAATAKRLGIVCVLKGHRTVISDGVRTYRSSSGNQAMATGGMGDVLTGLIAALVGQGLSPFAAATAGVYLHGLAGDLAAKSDRGLLAQELAAAIPQAYRKIGVSS
jgi:hydroxyethylthiazole kinase-like uncharacterized protein yjeF